MTTLGEKTDRLNEALREAEAALRSLNLGVTATTPLALDATRVGVLGFGKIDNEWILFYAPRETALDVTALCNANRAVRVAATKVLPALLVELQRQARTEEAGVEAAITAAREFARGVGRSKGLLR